MSNHGIRAASLAVSCSFDDCLPTCLPGPPQAWLVGNLLSFAKHGDYEYFRLMRKRYGNIFKVCRSLQPFFRLPICAPDATIEICILFRCGQWDPMLCWQLLTYAGWPLNNLSVDPLYI